MTASPMKIHAWAGKHKSRVRYLKKYEIEKFIAEDGKMHGRGKDWYPDMLTFAGPEAVLERMLCNWDILDPTNITTIQTYERLSKDHVGDAILKKLINTRKRHLPGMNIWPYNFHTFSRKYKSTGCVYPSNSKTAKWAKPPYKFFMDTIVKQEAKKFSVLDLDFCGIFSRKNSESVINLFKNKVVDRSGVAFITHQKGRDVRGGLLFDVLHGYLKNCGMIDFNAIPYIDKEGYETYVARYMLIPLYYMCKLYERGSVLRIERLVEYRDDNPDTGLSVNMLQYFFRWRNKNTMVDPYDAFRLNVEKVLDDSYTYHNWIGAD